MVSRSLSARNGDWWRAIMVTPTTRQEWIEAFASQLGVEAPTESDVEQILELAAIAAHSSERTAAPVASWIAAKTGLSLPEVLKVAQLVAGES